MIMDVAIGLRWFADVPKDRQELHLCGCLLWQKCRKDRIGTNRADLRLRVLTEKCNFSYRRVAIALIEIPGLTAAIFELVGHRGRRRGALNTGAPSTA